ncbi:ecdysone-inducible protein E75-like [Saccostrea echinata]|uniref:ecdysone-inducible protein E75-like n=1 Tax=Saccostrea echinata TaxID=191078 RepID=UPI002A832DE8|nr:ecdysone-inducible protein E75-like [Saccostrea echinata]
MVHGLTMTNIPYAAEHYIGGPKMTALSSPADNKNSYPIKHSVMVPLEKLMKLQTMCYNYDQFQKAREGAENDVVLNVTSVDGSSDSCSNSSKSEADEIDVEMLEENFPESHVKDLNSVSTQQIMTNQRDTFHENTPSPVNDASAQSHKQGVSSKGKGRSVKSESIDGHILCKICGDKASGFHYGVFSCEGCKGFFRRTVRQKLVYKPCENPNGCLIMRISRNRCQYCRMQRCIMAGMSHEAVRLGRCPKKDKPKKMDFFKLPQNKHGKVDIDKQIRSEQMVLTIHDAFRTAIKDCLTSTRSTSFKHLRITSENEARKFCSQYVTDMVRFISVFAREIPQFTQMDISDQKTLIKHCILESIIIHSVSLSPSDIEEQVKSLEDSDTVCHGPLTKLISEVVSCAQKLHALKLTEVELAILAAMLLFCADREDLKCSEVLEKMEIELYLALKCQFLLNHTDKTSNLFPKIVEIICSIRAISTLYMDDIMNSKVEVDDTVC